jgi:anti-sigma regulatory factor (Ser/Thr protein kinase)
MDDRTSPDRALGQWTADATADSIPELRHELGAVLASFPIDDLAVAHAFTEAASNVVIHAYPAGHPGELRVTAVQRGQQIRVSVADDGIGARGFTYPSLHPGLGLGLHLMHSFADQVQISHPGRGTTVVMTFKLQPAGTSQQLS